MKAVAAAAPRRLLLDRACPLQRRSVRSRDAFHRLHNHRRAHSFDPASLAVPLETFLAAILAAHLPRAAHRSLAAEHRIKVMQRLLAVAARLRHHRQSQIVRARNLERESAHHVLISHPLVQLGQSRTHVCLVRAGGSAHTHTSCHILRATRSRLFLPRRRWRRLCQLLLQQPDARVKIARPLGRIGNDRRREPLKRILVDHRELVQACNKRRPARAARKQARDPRMQLTKLRHPPAEFVPAHDRVQMHQRLLGHERVVQAELLQRLHEIESA
eukprot:1974948-Pleurochrysis_carterae.AAC.3